MTDDMQILQRDYLPADLSALMAKTTIEGTVAVQARQNLRETEWLLDLTSTNDFIKGVVGWVDLQSPDLAAQLEKYAPHPRLVGVRHVVHDEPDDQFMLRDGFLRGLSELQAYGLTYDLLLFPKHLPVAVQVVQKFPEQRFVLDHIAKPLIEDGVLDPWERDIRALAAFDNVFCKISGMITEAAWQAWQQSDFEPYLDIVFDCFGVDRLMFGSDWPVCNLSGSYSDVVEMVTSYIQRFPVEDRAKIMGGNAKYFYNLSRG